MTYELFEEFMPHRCIFIQVGLRGEAMNLGSPNSMSSGDWMQGSQVAQKQQPLTWYKVWGQERSLSHNGFCFFFMLFDGVRIY